MLRARETEAEQGSADRVASGRWPVRVATATALLGLPAMYFAAFFNRFAGLRSGAGEYAGGVLFLAGVLPYRDYFTAGPPLNTLKSALLLKLFGTALIVSRTAGVVERLLLCVVLYAWLRRIFGRAPALVAAIATTILSAADCTDPIASYNHDAILWAMLSGLLLAPVLTGERRPYPAAWLAFGAGLCAGLSALTKQTVGGAALLGLISLLAATSVRRGERRRGSAALLFFAAGSAVPLGVLALLMQRWHLLRPMLRMLFVTGPGAKAAHPTDFAVRQLTVAWSNVGWVLLGGAALAAAWRPLQQAFGAAEGRDGTPRGEAKEVLSVLIAGGGLLAAALVLSLSTMLPALDDVTKAAVYFVIFGLVGVGVPLLSRAARKGVTRRGADLLLLLVVSATVAASLSLSWPAFEAMLMPGLGLLLAALLSAVRARRAGVAYAAVAFAVVMSVREKLDRPFLFDGQQEPPVREATQRSTLPALRGMLLPASTAALLDGTVGIIQKSAREGDTVFTYPEMGLFYVLSGRRPPTFAGSHNMDVIPDAFARVEADRLLANPPKVLVRYRQTEEEMRGMEALWREGRPSGQRALMAAVDRLSAGYRLVATYRLAEGDSPLEVYVRPTPP